VEGRGGAAVVAARNCIACGKGGHTMETCRMLMQYEPTQRGQIAEVLQEQRQELEKFRLVSSVAMKATTLANSANRVPLRNQRRRLWDLGSNRNVTDESRASSIREEGTMVMGLGGKIRLKKVGLVNVLPGHAPLKTLVSDNVELDILAPLVLLNEEELNRELQLSMEIPHAACNEHELLLFSNVNGEKKLLCRIPEGEVIEGLFIDQQPADCHAQHASLAMPVTSASGGRDIFEAIAAEGYVRALVAEAAVDNGTRHWTEDEYQLLHAACVHMLTPPESLDGVDATAIDMVEVELDQPNANAGGIGATTCQTAFWKLHSDRLAHASVSTMRMIKHHNAIPGIPWDKIEFPDEDWKCSICLRAKAAQRAFQRPAPLRAQAYHTGQYLSTDLIGKFEISDMILDLVFFLTLICHFSGYLWLRPLQNKGQASAELISLLKFINKKWGVEKLR